MSARPFSDAEYAARADAVRRAMRERGLDAVLVWGRGGGTLDRCANLLYLTDHYPGFPTIPDEPGHWRDEGFAAALVTGDEVVLVTGRPEEAAATEVVEAGDLAAGVAEELRRRGLTAIGLAGGDALTYDQAQRLCVTLAPADDLLFAARAVKSPAEQALLKQAGAVGEAAMVATMAEAAAGRTQAQLAAVAAGSIVAAGAVPINLFVEAYGPGRARERHGLSPDAAAEPLRDGDVFTIDMSGAREGYLFDFARTLPVGGPPSHGQAELMALTREIVDAVVAELRPGRTAGDAAEVGARLLREHGHPLGEQEYPSLGHGLGLGFEPPVLVPGDPTPIRAGMCFAVERRINENGLGATFERNVVVTDAGPELLSAAPDTFN